jgi:hypothetical protein
VRVAAGFAERLRSNGSSALDVWLAHDSFFSNQRAAGGFEARICDSFDQNEGGMCVGMAALSRGLRQGPAIAAEITHLRGPTHRVMRFGIHGLLLTLCYFAIGAEEMQGKMWGFAGVCCGE